MRSEQPWRTTRAQALRSRASAAEAKLWSRLRNRQLGGLKFIRQAPIDTFFADFVCRERRAIIEVDGATHGEACEIAADVVRTRALERLGYRVLRVTNDDISNDLDGVLDAILVWLNGATA